MTEESTTPQGIKVKRIDQVCIVVRDVRESMRHYWETFGIGPWNLYELGTPECTELTYKGKPVEYKILMALADLDNIQLELIQPLEGEDPDYSEFLARHGEGVQHLQVRVDDITDLHTQAEAAGLEILNSGRLNVEGNPGGFTYVNTREKLGVVIEFAQRRPKGIPLTPIEVYP